MSDVFPDRGVSFSQLLSVDSGFMCLMALVSFLTQMQLLHILRYNRNIAVMANTLLKAKGDLLSLAICAFIFIVGFASLGYMMYGSSVEAYSNFAHSLRSMFVYMVGSFDYKSHAEFGGLGAKLFLILYLISSLILLMDIFITLLTEFLNEIKMRGNQNSPILTFSRFFSPWCGYRNGGKRWCGSNTL